MRHGLLRAFVWIALTIGAVSPAWSQEGKFAADLRGERERVPEKCGTLSFKGAISCASTIVTDHPFHLATGSLAPGNGFAFGVAFVSPQSKPGSSSSWRNDWSADAVGAPSGAWRTGVYMRFVRTDVSEITPVGPGEGTAASDAMPRPYPTFSLYGQTTSLPSLSYYGLGNGTALADGAAYAMRQTVVGGGVVWPLERDGFFNRLDMAAIGEANGRWVRVKGAPDQTLPSISTLYSDATAPGLGVQPATVQFGEGLRIAPAVGRLQLVYTVNLEEFVAPSDSSFSFKRWTVDLEHQFSLWSTRPQWPGAQTNTPNECSSSTDRTVGEYGCPDPTMVTTNRVGALGFRLLASRSDVSGGAEVPFYFQRTIGGSDIDGERLLASYDDYRFRAPNLFVLQETLEHVIWGPIGVFVAGEEGRVAVAGDPLIKGKLHKSFGAGLTARVGGMPAATIWWATGGPEGRHIAISLDASLLGGSSRPPSK